jgi:DNA-binding transcriptional LysR family regulator
MQRKPRPELDLPWDDVRLFLALCRAPTVGAAAKAIQVDASTVSRRLVALEESLAMTLFDRGRDGLRATKAAEDLLPLAEVVEEAMGRFAAGVGSLEREVSGLVRIACPPDVAAVIVAPLLGTLLGRHPALRIALAPGEMSVDLTRREADIALRTVRPARGDLVMTRLATVRWVVVAAPKLARSLGTLARGTPHHGSAGARPSHTSVPRAGSNATFATPSRRSVPTVSWRSSQPLKPVPASLSFPSAVSPTTASPR